MQNINSKLSFEDTVYKLSKENNIPTKAADIFINMVKFIIVNDWQGACHASSAILYIMLSEIGLKPDICAGEVKVGGKYFDHSWIELSGMIFDAAIVHPLYFKCRTAPVFCGVDVSTLKIPDLLYGATSPEGLNDRTKRLLSQNIIDYMNGAPYNFQWDRFMHICNISQLPVNINSVKRKYINVFWKIVNR